VDEQRPNFAAWNLRPRDYFACRDPRSCLTFLVRFAVLAPSTHNSQPWRFRLGGDYIDVLPEPSRRLGAADPDDHQLFISLGCALECLLVAADAFGLDPALEFPGGSSARVRIRWPEPVERDIPIDHLVNAIPTRRTNRRDHLDAPLPDELLDAIDHSGNEMADVHRFSDAQQRHAIGDLIVASVEDARSQRAFFRELARYLLSNSTSKAVGMTGETLGWSDWKSFLFPWLMRFLPAPAAGDAERARYRDHTREYVVVATDADEPIPWMAAGRAYVRVALAAEQYGVTTNNLTGPLMVPALRLQLAELLETDSLPQTCVRIGFASDIMPHSPRLRAEQVIVD